MNTTSEIWSEFSAPLRAFIHRRVRDPHVAEDLLQDVFVRVHGKLDSLADNDRVAAWLYRITRNTIIDHYRRLAPGELGDAEIPADPRDDASQCNQQVGACLGNFIARLPAEYREPVELAELQDMPQQAIADRIGLSLSGAKSRIQRGRRMLKALLLDCCRVELDRRGNVLDYERHRGKPDGGCATPASHSGCGTSGE